LVDAQNRLSRCRQQKVGDSVAVHVGHSCRRPERLPVGRRRSQGLDAGADLKRPARVETILAAGHDDRRARRERRGDVATGESENQILATVAVKVADSQDSP
jgi:hypothetical protein